MRWLCLPPGLKVEAGSIKKELDNWRLWLPSYFLLSRSSSSPLQTTVGKATARCAKRPWSSSTACSSWSRHGSRFPSSRACCRPAWTCGRSATRSTASSWSRPATPRPRTLPHTSATGSYSPAWAAPSCPGQLCSSTCDSTSRGEILKGSSNVEEVWRLTLMLAPITISHWPQLVFKKNKV